MRQQLLHKVFRSSCGKCLVEFDDEQMPYSEVTNQFDLVLRGRKQMGRVVGPKHFHRVRIKSNDHLNALCRLGVLSRGGNNGFIAAGPTLENTDGDDKRARTL